MLKTKKIKNLLYENLITYLNYPFNWSDILDQYKTSDEKINFIKNCQFLNKIDKQGDTILNNCVTFYRDDYFQVLLSTPVKFDVNHLNIDGKSALMSICQRIHHVPRNCEQMKYIIDLGADINQVDSNGNSALMLCVKIGSALWEELLKYSPDLMIKNKNNHTVMDIIQDLIDDPYEEGPKGGDYGIPYQKKSPDTQTEELRIKERLNEIYQYQLLNKMQKISDTQKFKKVIL